MTIYYTYRITCVVAWLPAVVSVRSLRCFGLGGIRCAGLTRHSTASGLAQVLRVSGKPLCMAALSFPLSQGFSTLHDINVFRCNDAEFSDNLAGPCFLVVIIIY